jgi:hypothetical protein
LFSAFLNVGISLGFGQSLGQVTQHQADYPKTKVTKQRIWILQLLSEAGPDSEPACFSFFLSFFDRGGGYSLAAGG